MSTSPIKERRLMVTRPGPNASLALTTIRENGASGPGIRITWIELGTSLRPHRPWWSPRVEMFSDCWLAFTELRDVFDALAGFDSHINPGSATPEAIVAELLRLGFVQSEFGVDVSPSQDGDDGREGGEP